MRAGTLLRIGRGHTDHQELCWSPTTRFAALLLHEVAPGISHIVIVTGAARAVNAGTHVARLYALGLFGRSPSELSPPTKVL